MKFRRPQHLGGRALAGKATIPSTTSQTTSSSGYDIARLPVALAHLTTPQSVLPLSVPDDENWAP